MRQVTGNGAQSVVWLNRRQAVQSIYLLCALAIFLSSIQGVLRYLPALGQPYGGFVWMAGPVDEPPLVSFDVPDSWIGIQAGLRRYDRIVSIEGANPYTFKQVYAAHKPGDLIEYTIRRGTLILNVRVPLLTLDIQAVLRIYLFPLVVAWVWLFEGYRILRSTGDYAIYTVAFMMLVSAALISFHSYSGSLTEWYVNPWAQAFLWAPCVPLLGGLAVLFALSYPRLNMLIPRVRIIATTVLAVSGSTALFYSATYLVPQLNQFQSVARNTGIAIAATGGVLSLLAGFAGYMYGRRSDDTISTDRLRALSFFWLVALLLLAAGGLAPQFDIDIPLDAILTLTLIFPLLLRYALVGISRYQEALNERERYTREVSEIRAEQERTLVELTNMLHDTALADARGVQYSLSSLRRLIERQDTASAAKRVARLEETLGQISTSLRRAIEGARPPDLIAEGLVTAVRRFITQLQEQHPETRFEMHIDGYNEEGTPQWKTDVYWIIRTALNNVRDHAAASCVQVEMRFSGGIFNACIHDNGSGFDVFALPQIEDDPARRHLGITNMLQRAKRIGGKLDIRSAPGDTSVLLEAPVGRSSGNEIEKDK